MFCKRLTSAFIHQSFLVALISFFTLWSTAEAHAQELSFRAAHARSSLSVNRELKGELRPALPGVEELEARTLEAVNQVRQANGLQPLRLASDLSEIARAHSRDMMERGYFAHKSPEGHDLIVRLARSGIKDWRYIAENLAYNAGYLDPVTVAVEGWLNSPGHRRNMLNKQLTESGIGVAIDNSGRIYFTQVFITRGK